MNKNVDFLLSVIFVIIIDINIKIMELYLFSTPSGLFHTQCI